MRFKSRMVWWLLVGIPLLFLISGYAWLTNRASKTRIDRRTAELIGLGMTRDQVQEIVGGPPGDYSIGIWPANASRGASEQFYQDPPDAIPVADDHSPLFAQWLGDRGWLYVKFNDHDDTVKYVSFIAGPTPSLYDRAKCFVYGQRYIWSNPPRKRE